jgi:hypothetical protein
MLVMSIYYYIGRVAVRLMAFPGSSIFYRRNMEMSYCKSMASSVSRALNELRNSLEMFLNSNTANKG